MCTHSFVMHYFSPGFNKHSGLWLFMILQLRCDTLILQVWPSQIMQKRNVRAKYLPLLHFETNSGTTTHSVEKKIILHDILHSSHVTILSCEKNSTSFTKHGSLQIAAKNGLLTNNSLLCMRWRMMRLRPKS